MFTLHCKSFKSYSLPHSFVTCSIIWIFFFSDTIVNVLLNIKAIKQIKGSIVILFPPYQTTPGPDTPEHYNVATNYPEYYPAMFNILLWFVVIFALAVYAASYMLASMDPGDTIIYRMTSQRIKME